MYGFYMIVDAGVVAAKEAEATALGLFGGAFAIPLAPLGVEVASHFGTVQENHVDEWASVSATLGGSLAAAGFTAWGWSEDAAAISGDFADAIAGLSLVEISEGAT